MSRFFNLALGGGKKKASDSTEESTQVGASSQESPAEKKKTIEEQAREVLFEIEYVDKEPTEVNPEWVGWFKKKAAEYTNAAHGMSGTGMYDSIQGHEKEARDLLQAASRGTISPSSYYKNNWVKIVAEKLITIEDDIAKTCAYHLLCLKEKIKQAETALVKGEEFDYNKMREIGQIRRVIELKEKLERDFTRDMEKVTDLKNQGL